MKPITPNSKQCKEIVDFLRTQLQIPLYVQDFCVHFDADDVIRVDCSYIPEGAPDEV